MRTDGILPVMGTHARDNVRHLLSSADLSGEEFSFLLEVAAALKAKPQRLLEGRQLALVFEKPSLRTRVSFQVGMRHLGGETIYLGPQEVGLGEREPIKDVARALSRYVHIVAVRTFEQEIIEEYARYSSVPVINALTIAEHPCQALADLLTLKEKWGALNGRSIAFVGDGNNVAASLVLTAASLGMDVRIASPRGYMLPEAVVSEASVRAEQSGGRLAFVVDPAEAVAGADAVYTDVWASMGQEREFERRRIDFNGYQLNAALVSGAAADALIMHDLPAHRGDEITDEVIESDRSIIFDQAENRVWAQAAVVAFLLGQADRVTT
jgi:ornithine carbamoyltransferase